MEASDQTQQTDPTAPGQEPAGDQEAIRGEQGEPVEQDPSEIGLQADGSVRQSAPPASAQSGVPPLPENEGVEPGEPGPSGPESGQVPPEGAPEQ